MTTAMTRETIHQAIDHLPESTLDELVQFIAFLQFKSDQSAEGLRDWLNAGLNEDSPFKTRHLADKGVADSSNWPSDFFTKIIGGWVGEPLERPEQGVFEERDELR